MTPVSFEAARMSGKLEMESWRPLRPSYRRRGCCGRNPFGSHGYQAGKAFRFSTDVFQKPLTKAFRRGFRLKGGLTTIKPEAALRFLAKAAEGRCTPRRSARFDSFRLTLCVFQ